EPGQLVRSEEAFEAVRVHARALGHAVGPLALGPSPPVPTPAPAAALRTVGGRLPYVGHVHRRRLRRSAGRRPCLAALTTGPLPVSPHRCPARSARADPCRGCGRSRPTPSG